MFRSMCTFKNLQGEKLRITRAAEAPRRKGELQPSRGRLGILPGSQSLMLEGASRKLEKGEAI